MFFNFISVVCSKYIEQALIYLIEHFSGSTDQHNCLKNKTGCRGNLASCGRVIGHLVGDLLVVLH